MDDRQMIQRHHQACEEFSKVVQSVDPAHWGDRSPCPEWDARGVLEHVIGFHEMILLRPLGIRTKRPKDDPVARWQLTVDALHDALERPGVLDEKADGAMGETTPRSMLRPLVGDVLIHSWDLAKAAGLEPSLDTQLCEEVLEFAEANAESFKGSDMFGAPVPVPADAPVCDRMLGFFGRDPSWTP